MSMTVVPPQSAAIRIDVSNRSDALLLDDEAGNNLCIACGKDCNEDTAQMHRDRRYANSQQHISLPIPRAGLSVGSFSVMVVLRVGSGVVTAGVGTLISDMEI